MRVEHDSGINNYQLSKKKVIWLVWTGERAYHFSVLSCSTRIARVYSACCFLHFAKTTLQYAAIADAAVAQPEIGC